MADPILYVPPKPAIATRELTVRAFLRAVRTNGLTMWPEAAYDEFVLSRHLFGRTTMLLNDPDAIHRVLVENPSNYRRSPAAIRMLRPLTGNGLLLSEGEDWRLQRRTIAPALAPRVLPMLARHILATAREVVTELATAAEAPINLLRVMQHAALEIAGRSMFSLETRAFGPALRAHVIEYGLRYSRPKLLDLLLPPSIPTLGDLRRRRFQARWMGFIGEVMRKRAALPPADAPRDLFDLLAAARDPETGHGFTHDQLRDQVATMILAGHETTGVTMFWALALLAAVPEQQRRVAEEVAGIDLSAFVARGTIPELPRTRAVVSETLRLYPPAFALGRSAIEPDRVGGTEIPKGAIIVIAPWVLHRHRKLWHEPDAFDPTRFLPAAPIPPRFAYLPFGVGPRVCVGAQFALLEATLMLASIIQEFEVFVDDPRPVLPVAVVTTHPDRAPDFRLRPRQPGAAECPSLTPSVATIAS